MSRNTWIAIIATALAAVFMLHAQQQTTRTEAIGRYQLSVIAGTSVRALRIDTETGTTSILEFVGAQKDQATWHPVIEQEKSK